MTEPVNTDNTDAMIGLSEDAHNVVMQGAATEDSTTSGFDGHCLVCYSELDYTTLLPCGHDEICPVCHLRLRYLHQDNKCPICKTEHEQVVVDITSATIECKKKFASYNIWGNDLGANFAYSENVGMFFPISYYHRVIQPLFGYQCGQPGCDYDTKAAAGDAGQRAPTAVSSNASQNKKPATPLRALQDHLRVKHRLSLCNLCVDHQRDFVAQLPRFTPAKLQQHLHKGDGPGTGFDGHPVCEFCKPKRFYDLTLLHQHLNKEHYKCHVCEKQGLANQYFKNYQTLERHFDRQHYLCHDVQCLGARFVVFGNELELRAHERSVHGGLSGDRKIALEFRYKRPTPSSHEVPSDADFDYTVDGQAFVPDALPARRDLELHPLHVQRTAELRRQALVLRQQQQDAVDGFPTLGAGNADDDDDAEAPVATNDSNQLRMGWASGATLSRIGQRGKTAGQVTDEDFPTLPAAAPAAVRTTTSSLRTSFKPAATTANTAGWASGGARSAPSVPVANRVTKHPAPVAPSPVNNTGRTVPSLGMDNFPTLSSASGPSYPETDALQKRGGWTAAANHQASAPSTQRPPTASFQPEDFPAPPSALSKSKIREKMLGDRGSAPHTAAIANTLRAPSGVVASSAEPISIADMKASLGTVKYKKLKQHVQEFAANELEPDAFVDHAAALFDRGYADADFWSFLPALIESMPNAQQAGRALDYMNSLHRLPYSTMAPRQSEAVPRPSQQQTNSWSFDTLSFPSLATQSGTTPTAAHSAPSRTVSDNTRLNHHRVTPKKAAAWDTNGGGNGALNVVRQSAPGSSSVEHTGTVTTTQAQLQQQGKQSKQHSQASGAGKKKKNAQNGELRALAFG